MSLDPYKGVRDFYPEDERIQKHIFAAMRRAVESFGYEEMNASVLEPTDLYTAKTSEEIVGKQTYTFIDRGERSVTLRPEMTPTVARMVAARKRELGFPLRWYSIQNFFRYERPQRGRLREFWQLNADLFGVSGIEADVEIIALAHQLMHTLGASERHFSIKVSSRTFMEWAYEKAIVPKDLRQEVTRLLDKKEKIENFETELSTLLGKEKAAVLGAEMENASQFPYFVELKKKLREGGVRNVIIDANITRGFDYYTGMVFEVFDTDPINIRSVFGGGRYDNLVGRYGNENVPAVGFAMGDVIARDFLETHNLLPELKPATKLYLVPVTLEDARATGALAKWLRANGNNINVAFGIKPQKMADHIRTATKLGIPYFAAYGEKERSSGMITIKNLNNGEEKNVSIDAMAAFFH